MSATYSERGVSPIDSTFAESRLVEGSAVSAESAVSWAAVLAGALTAVIATIVLVILGAGVGLTAVSPWNRVGATAAEVGVSTIVGLIVVQWVSAAFGGFIAGRLRTKWVGLHSDESFFRDTAHGFLAWALASVVGFLIAGSLTVSGVAGVAKGAAEIGKSAAAGAAASSSTARTDRSGYSVDTLFRSTSPADGAKSDPRPETWRILANDTHDGQISLSPDDRTYLSQMIASRTGISETDAEQRVDTTVKQINDTEQKAMQDAEAARKAAAHLSIALALSMVVGAFIACVAGALGGDVREKP